MDEMNARMRRMEHRMIRLNRNLERMGEQAVGKLDDMNGHLGTVAEQAKSMEKRMATIEGAAKKLLGLSAQASEAADETTEETPELPAPQPAVSQTQPEPPAAIQESGDRGQESVVSQAAPEPPATIQESGVRRQEIVISQPAAGPSATMAASDPASELIEPTEPAPSPYPPPKLIPPATLSPVVAAEAKPPRLRVTTLQRPRVR
jgi:hypothetical protein